MNTSHTVKKAGQKVSYLANQVYQVDGKVQSPRLIEMVFLNSLPKKYKSFQQLLEFHAKTLNQMIKSLLAAETQIKKESETSYSIDLAIKSARRSKE